MKIAKGCFLVIGIVFVAVVGVGILAAAFSTPQAADAARGQPLSLSGSTFVVTDVQQHKELTWTNVGNKATAAGMWNVVHVDVTNDSDESITYTMYDFELLSERGSIKHTTDMLGGAMYAELNGKHALNKAIPPGATVKMVLIFDVAQNDAPEALVVKGVKNRRLLVR